MFRDRRTTGAKIAREFADCVPSMAQEVEDFAASRIGDRTEHRLTLLWFQNSHVRNHKVTYLVTDWLQRVKRQLLRSFDHFVGTAEQRERDGEAECLRGLEIDHEFEPGRLYDRK